MLAWGDPHGLDVTLVDGDRISRTNCVRQPFRESEIGLHKATVLATRIKYLEENDLPVAGLREATVLRVRQGAVMLRGGNTALAGLEPHDTNHFRRQEDAMTSSVGTLLLARADVFALLTLDECIAAVEDAFSSKWNWGCAPERPASSQQSRRRTAEQHSVSGLADYEWQKRI
jgi:hypothetical protein